MTEPEFYNLLEESKTHFNWQLTPDGCIRGYFKERKECACCNISFCPITAVTHIIKAESFDTYSWISASQRIDLNSKFAAQIMTAADKMDGEGRQKLEKILLG